MGDSQAHRGPDGEGILGFDSADRRVEVGSSEETALRHGLVHRRLAILDTSDAGLQPMSARGRDIDIVFNGEIYNFVELRAELEPLGFHFDTGTDTEVLLAAYQHWGVGCFEKFNGMWALAILDRERNRLVLSRDRMGIKPLHYAVPDGNLIFASEIKGILASGLVEAVVDVEAAVDFLKWSLTNHGLGTAFAGVSCFPPGHYAEIDLARPDKVHAVSFWPLFDAANDSVEEDLTMDEGARELRELLRSSIQRRLRSDVDVGSCLSGGVDSSALVMLASEELEHPMHTFTAASENPQLDESQWAREVGERAQTIRHEVTPTVDDFMDSFGALARAQEEPFPSASLFAQWCVMREAKRKGIKVLLDGQGADELFLGYLKFYPTYLLEQLRGAGRWRGIRESLTFLLRGDRRIWKLGEGIKYLPKWLYRSVASCRSALNEFGKAKFAASDSPQASIRGARNMRRGDLLRFSLPSMLRYEDRSSMAWSVEARVPFLDPEVVAFALKVPLKHLFRDGNSKAMLREACRGLVPDSVLERRNKLGFEADQRTWMNGVLGEAIRERLTSGQSRLEPWYDVEVLAELSFSGRRHRSVDAELFRIYSFSMWLEQFDLKLPDGAAL
jgi:asparagine synthase (glutamine-hydrolysing)